MCIAIPLTGTAQGISLGREVPYPSHYEVRTAPDGRQYIIVRKFERRRVADSFHVDHSGGVKIVSAGSVRSVRPRGRGAYVTLRASNGHTFGVRTGRRFAFAGRTFTALGFHRGHYVVRCDRTGQRYSFAR